MDALVTYGFERDLLPATTGRILPGQVQGIYITLHPEVSEEIIRKIARWFEGRDGVVIVDHGTSDKQGFGFVLMEWIACEIDPLFLAILRDEEMVGDYTVYGRIMEE
jgi:hypothetical protein